MKHVWRIFLLLMILNDLSLISSEPQYQQQFQPQQQPQNGNYQNNYNPNYNYNSAPATEGGQQQPIQQVQQQQRPYQYPRPQTTPAPSIWNRLTSWLNIFGDDSSSNRPQQSYQQQQQQSYQPQPVPPPAPPRPQPVQPSYPPTQPQQQQQLQQLQQQVQLLQQIQLQQQLRPQQPAIPPPVQQPQLLQNEQYRNGSRAGLVSTIYGPPGFNSPQSSGGFVPINYQSGQGSGGTSFSVSQSFQVNPVGGHVANAPIQQQSGPYPPSTLQKQIIGSQQDPRILKPSQPVVQPSLIRDTEFTTASPGGPVPVPGVDVFKDFDYHPCNNVPWVPVGPPPGVFPGSQSPANGYAPNTIPPPTQKPIKLELKPKGQVQNVAPYPAASANREPAIITAAPGGSNVLQQQLQQHQQQLQTLQLQQLQLQQQQLQQQLAQLKVSTTPDPHPQPSQPAPQVQSAAPTQAHYVTRNPDQPVTAFPPITFRQVSASYFTNKDYHPPAKILPIQNEHSPQTSITLPNLSATPVPPLYTATSFHTDPYKFYRPHKARDNVVELGHGYPQSSKSMSDSYIRYNDNNNPSNDPSDNNNNINHSIFDVEQVASSSSTHYTTVRYTSEDSKPAASEIRNVTRTRSNQLVEEDEDDYVESSEEDDDRITGVTVTFPVEVTSVVPKTRYYSSRTSTTERPTTPPPPTDSGELGNGVQIIYSANLQTTAPLSNSGRENFERHYSQIEEQRPVGGHFNNLLSDEEEDNDSEESMPVAVSTPASSTKGIPIYTTFQDEGFRPTTLKKFSTEEPPAEITTPIPYTITTMPATRSTYPSTITAAIGGYRNITSTKKPKQIQIIIPYNTYKKPEPFKPKDDDDFERTPEESNIVTLTSETTTTPQPPIPHFVTRESMKYFHSTTNLRDILRKETTRPFSRPPTTVPEKPTKTKKVEPVKVSKESKPFTLRIPKMTPLPPVFNLTGLSADHRIEQTTTTPPRTVRPTIVMAHPSKFTPQYVNITRPRVTPTNQMFSPRTTLAQLLRTTKIITKPPKAFEQPEYITRPRPPIIYRRTTFPPSTTTSTTTSTPPPTTTTTPRTLPPPTTTTPRPTTPTTESFETTSIPIYERNEWDIDPLLLQRRIDTWTEQQYSSADYMLKTSSIPLHRVTKAIPLEFLTTTMLPSLRTRYKGRDSWHQVKIAISPHTKEKVYVVTPQPWTAIVNQQRLSSSLPTRFSIRPTPQLRFGGTASHPTGITPEVVRSVSPESVNDLVEHKSKFRVGPTLSTGKLKQRKYVRKKPFPAGGALSRSRRSSEV
ncbi:mucin-2-like isoform X1 [Uranotaenia lowii]|uniref:mucin-2-like isoform X1 n=1 Tax=Uranotaenia lowii TaxID=190385 RepID=UPI00247AC52A|nr:mucin-2-like isoform X1 [Uranotaenia lowii]